MNEQLRTRNPEKNLPNKEVEQPQEKVKESVQTQKEEQSSGEQSQTVSVPIPHAPVKPSTPQEKTPLRKEVERILQDNIGELFRELAPDKQREFKQASTDTANKIETLLTQDQPAMNSLVDVIKSWLMKIPGINRFFLEQEAKIKAEQLIITRRTHQT